MVTIKQLNKIVKSRPLTAKEKAILYYWNRAEGQFMSTGNTTKMSDVLLSFKTIFDYYELKSMIVPFNSEEELNEFNDWNDLIKLTIDYDHKGYIFFQKTLGLLNERSLSIYKPHSTNGKTQYSTIVGQNTDLVDMGDEITEAFLMFYRFLINILVNHIVLSNTFSLPKDILCVQALIQLTDIRKHTGEDDLRRKTITMLMEVLKEKQTELIEDYLNYLDKKN